MILRVGPLRVLEKKLANWLGNGPVRHFDLEDPEDQARLADPGFVLRELKGLVVLDEVQLRPDIFPLLRVLADREETPARFLLLGSAAPELLKVTAETLVGRVVFHQLEGLGLDEVGATSEEAGWLDNRWLRGSFPSPLLTRDLRVSLEWRGEGDPWPLTTGINAVPVSNLARLEWLADLSFRAWQ